MHDALDFLILGNNSATVRPLSFIPGRSEPASSHHSRREPSHARRETTCSKQQQHELNSTLNHSVLGRDRDGGQVRDWGYTHGSIPYLSSSQPTSITCCVKNFVTRLSVGHVAQPTMCHTYIHVAMSTHFNRYLGRVKATYKMRGKSPFLPCDSI